MFIDSYNPLEEDAVSVLSFADRLKLLIEGTTVSGFARTVGLSESLIRKYLKGSEPSLSRAEQIARGAQVNLNWLASGVGPKSKNNHDVNMAALSLALKITQVSNAKRANDFTEIERCRLLVFVYQFLQRNQKKGGLLDEQVAYMVAEHYLSKDFSDD